MKYFYSPEVLFSRRSGLIAGDVGVDHGVVVGGVQLWHFVQQAGVGLVDTLDGAVPRVPVVRTVLDDKDISSTSHTSDTLTFQGNLMLTEDARKYKAQPMMTL